MHWYTGVICLIVVMVLMYALVRGGADLPEIGSCVEPFWRCKRCGMMMSIDFAKVSIDCPRAGQIPNDPCPMELVGEDGKVVRDEE
jgi:hypothetical protein